MLRTSARVQDLVWGTFEANKQDRSSNYDARCLRMYEYLMAFSVAGCAGVVSWPFQVLFTNDDRENPPVDLV